MKKYISIVLVTIVISLFGCTQGIYYAIKNVSKETLIINFSLAADLLLDKDDEAVCVTLKPGEQYIIRMSHNAVLNRTAPEIKKEYISIKSFLSFFTTIEIHVQGTDERINVSRFDQKSVTYEHPLPSSYGFILNVK